MALTNDQIRERFELDDERTICWRRVDARGLPLWCQAKADEINRKAGETVHFFKHASGSNVVKLYGGMVAEGRIRKILQGQTHKDVAVERAKVARKKANATNANISANPAGPNRNEMLRASARTAAIKRAMGFVMQVTGAWNHSDGRVWSDVLLGTSEGIEATEAVDQRERSGA